MPTVVGVKLRFAPKVLMFDPAGTEPALGDVVIVETERGVEMGQVLDAVREIAEADLPAPLKPVVRIATTDDLKLAEQYAEKEREAMKTYRELISEHKLDMKPVDVEYLFDGEKVVFYFMAEERVDFRAIVRELATRVRARIDMRQIGVRDEARMVGGLGHCGQQLCCSRFAGDFQPVSIRMAKEQDLPLNPLKISGLCGRLMCCLRYEFEAYKDFKSRAPKRGALVETPLGEGKVVEHNTPRESVKIRLAEGGAITVPIASMQCERGCPCKVSREAMEKLDDTRMNTMLSRMSGGLAAGGTGLVSSDEPRRSRGGDRSARSSSQKDRGAQPAARQEGAASTDAEPSEAKRGSRRSKRRRSGGGGGEQKAAESAAPQKAAESAGKQKAAQGGGEQQAAPGASSGRRKRRRRPGRGGSASAGPGGESTP